MTLPQGFQELYSKLPKIQCKGLCQGACGPIAMTRLERKTLTKAGGRPPDFNPETLLCTFLSHEGRCEVYRARPMICRLYGLSLDMPCEHGCVPDRWLTKQEAHAFLLAADKLGGGTDKALEKTLRRVDEKFSQVRERHDR